jgi:hypothetical protein
MQEFRGKSISEISAERLEDGAESKVCVDIATSLGQCSEKRGE